MSQSSNSPMIAWWLQGLNLLVPTFVKNSLNTVKKRILIQLLNDQLSVIWPNTKKENTESDRYSILLDDERNKFTRDIARFSKDKHDIVLCIPANKGLRNKIKLPFNAESDLASIVEFEIERQTPFPRDQVYSGYKIVNKNRAANTLNVELNVIPKKQVDPQLSELLKIGVTPQVVELLSGQTEDGINVLPGSTNTGEHKATRRINKLLLALTVILLGIAIAVPFKNLTSQIKQTEVKIDQAKTEALEVNKLRSKWEKVQEKQNIVNTKIEGYRSVTMLLDELTKLTPDDTWLSRLHLTGQSIKLQGESSAATALISIIEGSEHFSDTRFQSPVTTNIATGQDRFQVTTTITSASQESSE